MGVKSQAKNFNELKAEVSQLMNQLNLDRTVNAVQNTVQNEILKGQINVAKNLPLSLIQLQRDITKRKDDWLTPIGIISGAYADAYRGWKTAIDNQEAWDQFMSQLLFSVLAWGANGSLGLLFERGKIPIGRGPAFNEFDGRGWQKTWKTKGIKDILSPGIQEVIKDAMDKTFDTLLPAYPKMNGIPDELPIPEPLEFQNILERTINEQFARTNSLFDNLIKLIKDTAITSFKPNADKIFDEIGNYYISVLNLDLLAPPKKLNRQEIARELETGLWAGWILRKNGQLQIDLKNSNFHRMADTVRSANGHLIQNQWRKLGIFNLAGVTDNSAYGLKVGADFKKLVPWANTWKPKAPWGGDYSLNQSY